MKKIIKVILIIFSIVMIIFGLYIFDKLPADIPLGADPSLHEICGPCEYIEYTGIKVMSYYSMTIGSIILIVITLRMLIGRKNSKK